MHVVHFLLKYLKSIWDETQHEISIVIKMSMLHQKEATLKIMYHKRKFKLRSANILATFCCILKNILQVFNKTALAIWVFICRNIDNPRKCTKIAFSLLKFTMMLIIFMRAVKPRARSFSVIGITKGQLPCMWNIIN